MAFLDGNGVTTLVTRLKNYFALKTDIPTVPTAYKLQPQMDGIASAGTVTSYALGDHIHPHDTSKQDKLVSGTNIKTVNGDSILGSGDLTVGGGTDILTDSYDATTKTLTLSILNGSTINNASGVDF